MTEKAPITADELLAVRETGMSLDRYIQLRDKLVQYNIDHDKALVLLSVKPAMASVSACIRALGQNVSVEVLLTVVAEGMSAQDLANLTKQDKTLTLDQLLAINRLPHDNMFDYKRGRARGLSCQATLDLIEHYQRDTAKIQAHFTLLERGYDNEAVYKMITGRKS